MSNYLDIPDDILHNILVRLPSKPLLRCRCVSKHWNRLISEPYFMKSRSRRMTILSTHSRHLHLLDESEPKTHAMAHSTVNLTSLFGPDEEGIKHATVVGSFNGIVLLALFNVSLQITRSTGHMILYNPLTQAYKKLPDPLYPFSYDASSYAFGFGYGATPDDLKIVRVEVHESRNGNDNGNQGSYCVFDLKKSLWSTPQDLIPTYSFYNGMAGLFLNGFLYWVAYRDMEKAILAFNVKEMIFSQIDLPHQRKHITTIILGSLKGCLSMISNDLNEFNLWVMKKEGIKNSWCKAFSYKISGVNYWFKPPSCIYILNQGRFVIMDNCGQPFIYDTLKHSCKLHIGLESDNYFGVHSIRYVESLVSPSDMCVA